MYMKAIQITFDEALLEELDATEEVRRHGRSAVLRRAVAEYLRRRRRYAVAESYRRAYGKEPGLGKEFEDWEDQGTWPDE
jgi:metal-responsive CopG/Arc/MetJ family transcriptional regulator